MMTRLTVKQAADYIPLAKGTLDNLRTAGRGPRFIKLGRKVLYDVRDLDRWIEDRILGKRTVDRVLDKFLEIYVPQKKLRSAGAIAGAFARYVRPAIGGKVIYDLDRADVTKFLDKIGRRHPRMADATLGYLRKAFNWWQTRDGKFKTPIRPRLQKESPRGGNRTGQTMLRILKGR